MKVTWYIDDNYVGGSTRPQITDVDDGDIEECDDLTEAMQLIDDYIIEDFEQKISWYMKNREKVQKQVQEILDNKEE